MSKIAFIFPGQGSQFVGMGKDFYEKIKESKEVFDTASSILNMDMKYLCFEENNLLNKTEYTQVAMVTACISMLQPVFNMGIVPDITAGLSLGEYSALITSGCLSFEDAIGLVRKRGIFMEEAVPDGLGKMSAILGLDYPIIENICSQVSTESGEVVSPANYNCPGQVVISGHKEAVLLANERLKEAGAKRVLELKVSGPFHTPMLKSAGEKLETQLVDIKLKPIQIPYVSNVTAAICTNEKEVKRLLKEQVCLPVRWQQSMEYMIEQGVTKFIEIGPGKTLSGFLKKINREIEVINIEKVEDLVKLESLTS